MPRVSKEANRAYQKKWYEANKEIHKQRVARQKKRSRDWFNEYKQGLSCARCGEADIACLDFHHTDPTTKEFAIGVGAHRGRSVETLLAEIAKCEVICANCHRKEHYYAGT